MNVDKLEIQHNEDKRKFFAIVNDQEAYLVYRRLGPTILEYYETFVPVEERKQGIGSKLVEEALDYAKSNNLMVVDTCPFVADYIDEHHEYEKIRVAAEDKKYYQKLPS